MRTEQLLRETLQDLADQARTPEVTMTQITGRLRRPVPRRRRTLVLVLVLAAVVVLVLAIAVPTFLVNRTADPVGRVKGNWNLTSRVELPPGWEIRQQTVSSDSETTGLGVPQVGGDEPEGCPVDVGGQGRPDATAQQPDRTLVIINCQPGFYAPDSSNVYGLTGVSWEYQPGAFALVSCSAGQAQAVAMAERVRFEPVPVRLPFRFRSLPPGYEGRAVEVPVTNSDGMYPGGATFQATDENSELRSFSLYLGEG